LKVLAIGAHFDDVELGCGGVLLRWQSEGHDVVVHTVTTSGYSDPRGRVIRSDEVARNEGIEAARSIGAELIEGEFSALEVDFDDTLNGALIEVFDRVKPDLVLTHWSGDTHRDHRIVARATIHCARRVPRLLMYRSNWYEGDCQFQTQFWVDISEMLEEKLKLIELYESENSRTGGAWIDFIRAEARLQGLKAGCEYAEGFQVVRWCELAGAGPGM